MKPTPPPEPVKKSTGNDPSKGVYEAFKYLIITATVIGAIYALALLSNVT